MREIDYIFLHCTATFQNATVDGIKRYWRERLGWSQVGYHRLIDPSGKVHELLPYDKLSNGVKGYNANSIHISYIGGIDNESRPIDNRTPAQIMAMIQLVYEAKQLFPDAKVLGHRDVLTPRTAGYKSCPSFDVKTWLKATGLNY